MTEGIFNTMTNLLKASLAELSELIRFGLIFKA